MTFAHTALGYSVPSLDDIKRAIRHEVADVGEDAAKEVLARLKPEIPGIVRSASTAAIDRLRPEIPGLVNDAISAARERIVITPKVKIIAGALGLVWVSSAVFSFLAWRK